MSTIERDTEILIDNQLKNLGWINDPISKDRNVYLQTAKSGKDKIKLNGLKPDYILYQSGTDSAIAIIEAKKGGENLDKALNQAIDYAKCLGVKIVFATNGSYYETRFLPNNKGLILKLS